VNRLIIIGASGHGKVVADIAVLNGYRDIVFLDNDPEIKTCAGYSVLGPDTMTSELDGDVFVAVGNAETRKRLMERDKEKAFPVLIHPSAVVAKDVEIDAGSVVMAGAVINPGVIIGKGCIINTSSSVDHDCIVEDYCHVSVGAHLSGTIVVGTGTWIGAGAIVSNNINICGGCMIGAGAVVIKDINESGIYIGVPAKLKN
jgi:sugar O-acyltransferase (sialic acid O-acetyltransferase NeuD family)